MGERYHAEEGYGGQEPTLDELLCEYVDGTMDPMVREVFEEVLRSDPELAEEVQELCCTRDLLCRYGCRRGASAELEERFHRRLTAALSRETVREQTPVLHATTARLSTLATLVSVAALAVTVSLCAVAVMNAHSPTVSRTAPTTTTESTFYTRPAPTSPALDGVFYSAPERAAVGPLRVSTVHGGFNDVAFLQRTNLQLDARP